MKYITNWIRQIQISEFIDIEILKINKIRLSDLVLLHQFKLKKK